MKSTLQCATLTVLCICLTSSMFNFQPNTLTYCMQQRYKSIDKTENTPLLHTYVRTHANAALCTEVSAVRSWSSQGMIEIIIQHDAQPTAVLLSETTPQSTITTRPQHVLPCYELRGQRHDCVNCFDNVQVCGNPVIQYGTIEKTFLYVEYSWQCL